MQPKQDMLIPEDNKNTSENFMPHEDEKSIFLEQDIEKDYRNLVGKSLDTGICVKDGLSGCTP